MLTLQDRCGSQSHLKNRFLSGVCLSFQWPKKGMVSDHVDNINTEQTFSSSKDGLWRKMKTTCHFKGNKTDRTSPRVEDDWCEQDEDEVIIRHQQGQDRFSFVSQKVDTNHFHQYTPSKHIERQCETGPSICTILRSQHYFCHYSAKYHSVNITSPIMIHFS